MEKQQTEDEWGHPALTRAFTQLAQVEGLPVQRAAGALSHLLTRLRASTWPEVAWCSSALTSSGFPVEFAFASHGQEIRYTTEIAGPETTMAERLPLALTLMEELTERDCQTLLPPWLAESQRSAPLHYGAWLSGRHDAAGDRYKLYAEVPDDEGSAVCAYVRQWLGQDALLTERKSTLRMIGVEPVSGCVELYFRLHHLELHHLYPLLAHTGGRAQAAVLVDFLQTHRRWPAPHRLPGNATGVSYLFTPTMAQPVCTLFLSAGRLWGTDVAIREKLMQLGDTHQWQMAGYGAVSQTLPPQPSGKHRHGLVGLSVGAKGGLGLGVGVGCM